jgi:IrrE N-terminal-like domain
MTPDAMTPDELELCAEALLAEVPDYIWNGESLPVPIDEIADTHVGLLIRDVADLTTAPGAPQLAPDQSLSGLLLASKGEIWVNASEGKQWPPRRRFTIGHELGHWQLHRAAGQQALFCRRGAVEEGEVPKQAGKKPPSIEDEANVFAAALLMPRHLMREHYERLKREDDCHPRMCKLFGASRIAMGKRLHTAIS